MLSVSWVNPAGGDWDNPSNWSTGTLPGLTDDVVINVVGAVTIAHSQNVTDTVQSITASDPIVISGGTLGVSGQISDSSAVSVAGGTLAGATITATTVLQSNASSTNTTQTRTLSDITLAGTLNFLRNDTLKIAGAGLTLSGGTVHLSAGGALNFAGTQALHGTGEVTITTGSIKLTGAGGVLTIEPGVTVDGSDDSYNTDLNANSGKIVNQGTIDANASGVRGFAITSGPGGSWVNDGTVEVTGGNNLELDGNWTNDAGHSILADSGNISFNGTWSNLGTFTSSGTSDVYLSGSFTLDTLGSYTRDSAGKDTFIINGTLDLTGQTLDSSNYVQNDTIKVTGAGLTLAGGAIAINGGGALNFTGTQSLAGIGTVSFTEGSINLTGSGGQLTIAAGVALDGKENDTYSTNLNAGSGTIDNQGTIDADSPGGQGFTITTGSGGSWVNNGTIEATAGGALNLTGSWINEPGHLILVDSGTVSVNGSWSNQGTFASSGASVVYLGGSFTLDTLGTYTRDTSGKDTFVLNGTLNLAGGTLDSSAGPGKWVLDNATVIGGTIAATLNTNDGNTGVVGSSAGGSVIVDGTIASESGGTITVQNMTNFTGGTLTGGTWQASGKGILRLIGAGITTNAANLVLDGSSSRINSDTGTTSALASFATNTATGSFTIRGGATFTPSSNTFQNAGAVTIGNGSALAVAGYTQTAGSTTLQGGKLGASSTAVVMIEGGTLSGPGTIDASLTNGGAVDPGSAPGILSVQSSYTQAAAGTLSLTVGGATADSQFDQVVIAGAATLGGTLDVSLVNGFGPSATETFPVLTFAGSGGGFAKVNLPQINGRSAFITQTTPTTFNLVGTTSAADLAVDPASIAVTPSPATIRQDVTVSFTVENRGDGDRHRGLDRLGLTLVRHDPEPRRPSDRPRGTHGRRGRAVELLRHADCPAARRDRRDLSHPGRR